MIVALVLLGSAVAVLAGPPLPAWAHNALRSTEPDDGAEVASPPSELTLTYDQAVGERFATVVVTGPAGGRWEDGEPRMSGAVVTQALRPLGPAGTYEVAWRVVSADGHPIWGTFAFTLTEAGDGTPAPDPGQAEDRRDDGDQPGGATADAGDNGRTDRGDSHGDPETEGAERTPRASPPWPLVAGGLVLAGIVGVAAVVALVVVSMRRSSSRAHR